MGISGKNAVVKLDNAAGSLTDLSQYFYRSAWNRSVSNFPTGGYGDTAVKRAFGIADGKLDLESQNFTQTLQAHLDALIAAAAAGTITSTSFEFGPMGSTAGYPKYTGELLVVSYDFDVPFDSGIGVKVNTVLTGAVTTGTY